MGNVILAEDAGIQSTAVKVAQPMKNVKKNAPNKPLTAMKAMASMKGMKAKKPMKSMKATPKAKSKQNLLDEALSLMEKTIAGTCASDGDDATAGGADNAPAALGDEHEDEEK